MTQPSDFATRIARINAKSHSAPPARPPSGQPPRPAQALPWNLIGSGFGIVLLGGVIGLAWDDIAVLFPSAETGRRPSYLEAAVLGNMTEAEVERMQNNPDFEGMSTMQKLILSH